MESILRRADILLQRTSVRLSLFAILALVTAWAMLARANSMSTYRDAQFLFEYEEVARKTVREFGQFPIWNPYYCGGIDGLGTPQSRFVSPTFFLTLLFGTARGEALTVFVMLGVGLEGMFRYLRSRGAASLPSFAAAPFFAMSGTFAMAPALGWTNFMGFELIPWVLLGLRRALRNDAGGILVTALFFSWMVGFGGTYAAPLTLIYAALEFLEIVLRREPLAKKVSPLTFGVLALAFAAVFAMVRLLPIAETIANAPRIIGGTPATGPRSILRALVGRIKPDAGGDFPIAGTFLVGWAVLPAVVASLVARRSRAPFISSLVFLWLAAGYNAKIQLFRFLRELPLYSSLRFPERFLTLFAIAVSVLAALGLTRLFALSRKKPQLGGALAIGTLFALLAGTVPLVRNHWIAADGRPLTEMPAHTPQEFKQARGNRWLASEYPFIDRGSLSCFDAYPVPMSTLLRSDLAKEEYPAPDARAQVQRLSWSPNRIELKVIAETESRIFVNQNWHGGWHTNVGRIENQEGLLSVIVPPGEHTVTLRFLPRAFVAGAVTSLVGLVALVLVLRRRKGEARTTKEELVRIGGALVASLALGGVTYLLISEEKPPPMAALTPEGEPIAVDALPNGVTPLDVQFEAHLSLVGARLSPPVVASTGKVRIEFDWKTERNVEGRLGFFVHLVPDEGERIQPDHVMISNVLEIERAPAGKILRDVMEVDMADEMKGKTWQVFVGLWRVRRDGSRVKLTEAHGAKVENDAVHVGEYRVE